MRSLLLALLLFASAAHADDDWTRQDTYRQAALTTLLVVDWAQTRYIVKNPNEQDGESNPVLGSHPSTGRVNNYFAASIAAHAAISIILPPTLRHGWQYVWIGAEVNQLARNYRLGVRMNF